MDLNSPVGAIPFVGPVYQKRLQKLGIESINDLLTHVPYRYLDFSLTSNIGSLRVGETVTTKGEILSIKNIYTRSGRKMQLAEISDGTGKISAIWFNQPFLVRTLIEGETVALAGELGWFNKKPAFVSPEYEKIETNVGIHTGRLIPIYHETSGISSKWLRRRIMYVEEKLREDIEDYLPKKILEELNFPNRLTAISEIHFPSTLEKAESARRRLAFDELFFLQLSNIKKRLLWQKNNAPNKLSIDKKALSEFIDNLPFELTASQARSIDEILSDFDKDYPMNRLLEGDVGSGKTVVAAVAAFIAFSNGYQTIFMAPTQILAQQHYKTLSKLFEKYKARINLLTSEEKMIDIGRADIFVGTHALIHKKVKFDKVALVVIDEQHRFGVEQRALLIRKSGRRSIAPHILTMTATPIPRTVALAFYGDLDLSTLNELPIGRQKITTWLVQPQKRGGAYDWMKVQMSKFKCQSFVVCPLIEESRIETMKQIRAVKSEYENLKKIFLEFKIGLLHGRQAAKEKNKVLKDFRNHKIHILVATPVVEVGIDIPNATIMVIEGAERFGLAQLHQLRGRVGRGQKKSYCLLFTESASEKAGSRLNAMTKSISGFELAELDLRLRGPGEIFGTAQSGFPELRVATWNDIELMKKAKEAAEKVFTNPENYPGLATRLDLASK